MPTEKKIPMVALKAHQFAGVSRKVGDEYEAEPSHARLLRALKKSAYKVKSSYESKDESAERTYDTTMLSAESSDQVVPAKRAYKRRDLTAQ
jgi:hypothetical protein